ncbi:hypothetical protein GO986_12125 [Deinococcus sp. HMF7620]|uniref:Uncharacterized protein n=1 Tax=Deinococcus arboris TaxID=2682977 RepID=A0A7C9HS72_9DEIO|nr:MULTISPECIES: hypothetical protein [Deinococcus]MBZ9752136.1 hypothetical protein [Deinococcus betulae]MVN87512.1 hypothetical protein [Deinococcus arboris]
MKGSPIGQPEEGRPGDLVEAEGTDQHAVAPALPSDPELERQVFHHLAQALREVAPDL